MASIELVSCSPERKIIYPNIPPNEFRPYGGSTSLNLLEYFHGTPETVTQVTRAYSPFTNCIYFFMLIYCCLIMTGYVSWIWRFEECFADSSSVFRGISKVGPSSQRWLLHCHCTKLSHFSHPTPIWPPPNQRWRCELHLEPLVWPPVGWCYKKALCQRCQAAAGYSVVQQSVTSCPSRRQGQQLCQEDLQLLAKNSLQYVTKNCRQNHSAKVWLDLLNNYCVIYS